ncbi:MAG: hypothetical protein RIM72_18620 [Alphaproteobacteria bacterium]
MSRTEKDKQDLDNELHAKLDELNASIAQHEKLAKEAKGDTVLEYHRILKDLREERDSIRVSIDTVETHASID